VGMAIIVRPDPNDCQSFASGWIIGERQARQTIQGYEAIHMLRKGQVRRICGKDVQRQNRFIERLFELTT
jgi:hypothetical protein